MWAVAARVRGWSARHPRLYWVAVGALTIWVVSTWVRSDAEIDRRREAWGESIEVWMASGDHAIGEALDARSMVVPRAVVPMGAVASSPIGRSARRVVADGEIVLDIDVGDTAVAGAIAPGEVALNLRTDPPGPFSVGDAVVVLTPDAAPIDGHVIAIGEATLTVAVQLESAGVVATAMMSASATVALASGDD